MKRFTGHKEPWGGFVDVKVNAVELMTKEIARKKRGDVWISGVCDPYQPLEAKYELTRGSVAILIGNDWPVRIQTKSDLVVRDLDILRAGRDCDVGFSVATADDFIRTIMEPKAPSIEKRITALASLHKAGIQTYVMIAPILPGAENLIPLVEGIVDYIYVDRMNYGYANTVYKKYGLEEYATDGYFADMKRTISRQCRERGIPCSIFY